MDVTRGGLKADRAFVQGAIDVNVPEFPALEAGFVVMGMVAG